MKIVTPSKRKYVPSKHQETNQHNEPEDMNHLEHRRRKFTSL